MVVALFSSPPPEYEWHELLVPVLIVLLLLYLPLRVWGAFRDRRLSGGRICPRCAYNLHATPGRPCPECGADPSRLGFFGYSRPNRRRLIDLCALWVLLMSVVTTGAISWLSKNVGLGYASADLWLEYVAEGNGDDVWVDLGISAYSPAQMGWRSERVDVRDQALPVDEFRVDLISPNVEIFYTIDARTGRTHSGERLEGDEYEKIPRDQIVSLDPAELLKYAISGQTATPLDEDPEQQKAVEKAVEEIQAFASLDRIDYEQLHNTRLQVIEPPALEDDVFGGDGRYLAVWAQITVDSHIAVSSGLGPWRLFALPIANGLVLLLLGIALIVRRWRRVHAVT